METIRKGFYAFDLLMLVLLAYSVNHTVTYDNNWAFLFMDYALLLRFNSLLLLYRKEAMNIIPIAVFMVLFSYFVLSGTFQNTIFRMWRFPEILFDNMTFDGKYVLQKNTCGESRVKALIGWAWLMPIVTYIVQRLKRITVRSGYRWYELVGLAIFKR